MTPTPRLSPVFAPVQDLFHRHVFGRAPAQAVASGGLQAQASVEPAPVVEEDIEDFVQRVRSVGEW